MVATTPGAALSSAAGSHGRIAASGITTAKASEKESDRKIIGSLHVGLVGNGNSGRRCSTRAGRELQFLMRMGKCQLALESDDSCTKLRWTSSPLQVRCYVPRERAVEHFSCNEPLVQCNLLFSCLRLSVG